MPQHNTSDFIQCMRELILKCIIPMQKDDMWLNMAQFHLHSATPLSIVPNQYLYPLQQQSGLEPHFNIQDNFKEMFAWLQSGKGLYSLVISDKTETSVINTTNLFLFRITFIFCPFCVFYHDDISQNDESDPGNNVQQKST